MGKFKYPDNLRVNLYRRFKWFENRVANQAKTSNYDYLTLSQIRAFAFLQGRSMTISELAKIRNISRQAVQKTISSLKDRGLVELTECSENLSAKRIELTAEGRKVQIWSKRAVRKAEKELAAKIGPERLKLLNDLLNEDWG